MAEKSSFMGRKSSFKGKKSSFKLFGKIEFPSKRTKKACSPAVQGVPVKEKRITCSGYITGKSR